MRTYSYGLLARDGNTDLGSLKVGVYATDVGKPAPDATVRIRPHGYPTAAVEELVTDGSGQSPVVDLPAPPIEYSMAPEEPRPYSEYDIDVSLDGYDKVSVEGVQIYPGSRALQDVKLYPSSTPAPALENIVIPEPTLYGEYPPKIPEAEVKELPPPTGFVVLPEPVVPETIVVHEGAPDNPSAANYWVPYKDYIKNVASCEIYSTWPQSTIRANVLAIISFTLNRVFTEWYRSKGYYFTITNSTAYDHAFIYGRNIFEEISVVVDEIFAQYITKPSINQPLFTQYCDGQYSQCPDWMTQWGSKDLGDQGYSSLDILRHFYGANIYLTSAEKVEGVPMSFPGTALTLGSSGDAVRTIQEQLNAISNNYPAIGKLRVDGQYTEAVVEAVERFQSVFNLPVTGVVDYATWYKISDIFVAVTRMAELS